MDYLDKYAEQLRRQNLGYTCEYCDSAAGHRVSCVLLNSPYASTVITGPDFDEQKYKPTDRVLSAETVQSIDDAVAAVAKYSRSGSPKMTKAIVPTEGDHIMLRGAYISWEGDKR